MHGVTAVSVDDIPERGKISFNRSAQGLWAEDMLVEFVESGDSAWMVEESYLGKKFANSKEVNSATNVLRGRLKAKRFKYVKIKVFSRSKKIYLVKEG